MDHPFATSLDVGTTSLENHTGSWRTSRPVYVDRLPPCNHGCPAGEKYPGLALPRGVRPLRGGLARAHQRQSVAGGDGAGLLSPCEIACNRAQVDVAVGINSVERFLGDEAIKLGWTFRSAGGGDRQARAGGGRGPVGPSAAYHLRALGHAVAIHEAGPMAGGMMRFGIPKYRLPRDVLDAEVSAS